MDMIIRQAITEAALKLANVSDTPRLDAELLMAHALGATREALLLQHMDDAAPDVFAALVECRMRSEPIAYITGTRDFWTISLAVTPDVLIPRPDTETLIEAAVEQLAGRKQPRLLDLGTGSGALLLAVLDHWPKAWGVGIDRSAAAVRVAAANALRLGLDRRARFAVGDWASAISGQFDGIFCNPPYISSTARLPRDVADYEPQTALFAGADGLDDYRRLVPQLPGLLAPEGYAFLEIGADQALAVMLLAKDEGLRAKVRPDIGGRDRCVILTRS